MVPPAPLRFSTTIGLPELLADLVEHDARQHVGEAAGRERHDRRGSASMANSAPTAAVRDRQPSEAGDYQAPRFIVIVLS